MNVMVTKTRRPEGLPITRGIPLSRRLFIFHFPASPFYEEAAQWGALVMTSCSLYNTERWTSLKPPCALIDDCRIEREEACIVISSGFFHAALTAVNGSTEWSCRGSSAPRGCKERLGRIERRSVWGVLFRSAWGHSGSSELTPLIVRGPSRTTTRLSPY